MASVIKPHMTSRKSEEMEKERKKSDDGAFRLTKELNDSKILWLLIIALFMVYLVSTKFALGYAPVFAIIIGVTIVAIVALEVWVGAKTGGLAGEMKETILAILVAGALWYGGGLLLGTSTPLDAVVSCSMLPALARGDMLVLHGGQVQAPLVEMSREDWDAARAGGLLQRQCGLCQDVSGKYGCQLDMRGGIAEATGIFDYECTLCEKQNRTDTYFVPCVTGVRVGGGSIDYSKAEETIVYMPRPTDYFAKSGDIVHRAQFIVKVDGKEYLFTKGDNNAMFDVQAANSPIEPQQVKGRALVRLPYVGYFKLFLSGLLGQPGLFQEPAGCDQEFTGTQALRMPLDS